MISISLALLSFLVFVILDKTTDKSGFILEKLGIPLFWDDVKWTWFIYKNLKNLQKVDSDLKETDAYNIEGTNYYVIFMYSWLFEVIKSESSRTLGRKYSLGGQSNKASYLTWWQKIIGKKIENWYLANKK